MDHADVRTQLSLDERTVDVDAHVAGCAQCQEFLQQLHTLDRLAPLLAATPPEGLVDGVLRRIAAEDTAGAAAAPEAPGGAVVAFDAARRRSSLRAAWRNTGVRLTAAAAVVLVAAGLLVVRVAPGATTASDAILASADATAATGSAAVDVRARTEVVVEAGRPTGPGQAPAAPPFAQAPAELRPHLRAEWDVALRQFERAMDVFMRDAERVLDEGTRQMEQQLEDALEQMDQSLEALFGGGGDRPRRQPRPRQDRPQTDAPSSGEQVRAVPEPPPPPTAVSAEVFVRARGGVDFDGETLALDGAVTAGAGSTAQPFTTAAAATTASVRTGTSGWRQAAEQRSNALAAVLLDPAGVLRIARGAGEDARDLGTVRVEGETLQRYRFRVDPALLGEAAPTSATVLIDGDGLLRRMTLRTRTEAGPAAAAQTEVTVRLSGFGERIAAVDLPDSPRQVAVPEGASRLLYPLGAGVAASTGAEVER